MEKNTMPMWWLQSRRYRIIHCIVLLLLIRGGIANAQYNGNYWCFGDSALIDWSNPPTPVVGSAAFYWRNGSSTIGDSSGLLLYSGRLNNILPNNCCVWNKYHNIITGGDYIFGGAWYHSTLLISDPINDSCFYLFTSGVTNNPYGFYYTTINYKANNDSGLVIQKNVQLNNFPAFDGLMAVRHGNGRDWWVIFQRWFPPSGAQASNTFYLYLINDLGLNGPFLQSIGSNHSTNLGHLIFSNNAEMFAQVSIRGMIELYNFDRCTGTITSTIPIEQEPATAPYPRTITSCAFSPDDSKLYVIDLNQSTSKTYLLQYDLLASNISGSKFVVDSFVFPVAPWQLKLAPDGKIYMSAYDQNFGWPYPDTITAYTTINNNLSVINYPDSLGAACDFQPFSFNLGTGRSYFGLPNNPDYELGAWVGSPCDTLTVGIAEPSVKHDVFFQAWYNHEWDLIHFNASKLKGKNAVLRLFDVQGRLVQERRLEVIPGGYLTGEIQMQGLAKGVYILSLVTEREKMQGKVMIF
jgi:hypothetical protein